MSRGSAGGKATALIFRKAALDRYYANPKICKNCSKIIEVKAHRNVSETRAKNYCDMRCFAISNQGFRKYNENRLRVRIKCRKCKRITPSGKIFCKSCYGKEKHDLWLARPKHTTDRGYLGARARLTLMQSGRPKACEVCNYTYHVEACHIKPVANFGPEALIGEINALSNLKWLCANHHWELDNPEPD